MELFLLEVRERKQSQIYDKINFTITLKNFINTFKRYERILLLNFKDIIERRTN